MSASSTHSLEKFEIVELERASIRGAPYNPRIIGKEARAKLKKGLQRLGMLAPIVWNKQTGNLVSGHQRLEILDQTAESKNYRISVSVVDLDPTREKEANLLLNNYEAQGEWDLEKLGDILKDDKINLEGTGFDPADIYRLFGDSGSAPANEAAALADQLREAQSRFTNIEGKALDRDTPDFFLVFVFKDNAQRRLFTDQVGLADNQWQSGDTLLAMTRPPDAA